MFLVPSLLAIVAFTIVDGIAVPATNVTLQTRACQPPYDAFPFCNTALPLDDRVNNLISLLLDSEIPPLLTARHNQSTQTLLTNAIPRLGIPAYDSGMNAIHGVQSNALIGPDGTIYVPTSFPNPVNFGATFNDSLTFQMGAIIGMEARALWLGGAAEYNGNPPPVIGLDAWSPNINIARDPRWGRNQEVASEDPLVNGRFGVAYTTGLQNNSVLDPNTVQVVVTLKHWSCYSLEDSDGWTRYDFDANVSSFALQDTYFPAFRASVVEGGALGVMCSYNAVNGFPTCASAMLSSFLRGTWGFQGYITSDSGAIEAIYEQHKTVNNSVDAACIALRDGTCDMCSGEVYATSVLNATTAIGAPCNRGHLVAALQRTLRLRFQLGLFDPEAASKPYWNVPLTAINATSSQTTNMLATLSSMVLTKSDELTLPLPTGRSIAVIGPNADQTQVLVGNYLGQICPVETHIGNTSCLSSIYASIRRFNEGGATTITAAMPNVTSNDTSGIEGAVAAAQAADIVVLVMGIDGTVEGEMRDRVSIDLPGVQHQLIAAVAAVGKPVVLVLLNGGCVDVSAELANPAIGAILAAGYPGVFGGDAVAMTLFGLNDHLGGKLATTWYPEAYTQQILMSEMELDVGVGRGYRYYSGPVVFPFAYGLSLTTFSFSDVASSSAAPIVLATTDAALPLSARRLLQYSINVTNTGNRTGDEVVFLFMEPNHATLSQQPASNLIKQLLDYQRVHLAPGESTVVSFNVSAASFKMACKSTGNLVATPGEFTLVFTNGVLERQTRVVSLKGQEVIMETFPVE